MTRDNNVISEKQPPKFHRSGTGVTFTRASIRVVIRVRMEDLIGGGNNLAKYPLPESRAHPHQQQALQGKGFVRVADKIKVKLNQVIKAML